MCPVDDHGIEVLKKSAEQDPGFGSKVGYRHVVRVDASALPNGAATESTLQSIDAGIPVSLGQKTMANSMPVVLASDQGNLPYSRIDELRSRTEIRKFIENVTLGAGTTIHTVTNGKILYVTLAIVTAVNTANTVGRFTLQDGTDVNDRIPFICPQQPVGNNAGYMQAVIINEFNPIEFASDVRAIGLSGTIAASITIHGYEE